MKYLFCVLWLRFVDISINASTSSSSCITTLLLISMPFLLLYSYWSYEWCFGPLWRPVMLLRGNIIRTALCWIVWHNVRGLQHTYVSSSHRSNRLGLSHWDPYAVHRGGCLELYYCNMVEWFWWDSSLISTTNWFPSVLWHCWFDHLACKNRPQNELLCVEWDVKPYTLTHSLVRLKLLL